MISVEGGQPVYANSAPMVPLSRSRTSAWLAAALIAAAPGIFRAAQAEPNTLTPEERAAGWQLLFDGQSMSQWRVYGRSEITDIWQVVDGAVALVPGDLITREQFGDFELALDWKLLAEGGNSGVMFRVIEGPAETYHSGPEMQILDNAHHRDGTVPETSVGANYALHAPTRDASRPIGQWNSARLVVVGPLVEHWLNGEKVVAYELWTQDWKARVARSKFREWPTYGTARRGHIVLQDHGSKVAFRNLKIRVIR